MAAKDLGITRFFYASSACVYNGDLQTDPENPGLKEADAYPALAEDGYGWEKLFSERMCRHFMEDFDLTCRVARFHNVYGPFGTYDGGREKAPAAMARKVIDGELFGKDEIIIWGDGEQTRSFMYIDDCVDGILKIMYSDILEPINLGSDEMVSINQLVDIAAVGRVVLEIVAVNFMLLKKAVAFGAVIHKDCLQARFYPGNDTFIDVSVGDFPRGAFDMKLFEFTVPDFGDAALFGIDGVDKNFTGHKSI